jgi:hypothetical protein
MLSISLKTKALLSQKSFITSQNYMNQLRLQREKSYSINLTPCDFPPFKVPFFHIFIAHWNLSFKAATREDATLSVCLSLTIC